jgi:serine/threonine-protein kinase
MATVYLGRDEVLDRPVAVKVLKQGFDEDIAGRFQREGRTAARLSHPNIVQVFDAGEAELEGRLSPYIVMEHVAGGDLKNVIDSEGSLASERVAKLGAGISAGLVHAHDRGVIHRDIKPHNILLDETDFPKLTDFGIARALDATTMTGSGVYLGTALYSAPEQLKGEEITPKSDVYSLGAALYQAATGSAPFSGPALEVANQHAVREPEAPGSKSSSATPDPELDALILACLAKEPADRPTAAEARDRLQSLTGGAREPRNGAAPAPKPGNLDKPGKVGKAGAETGRSRETRNRVASKRVKRRKPVLRTFAGAVALVLVLIAGAVFAMMSGGLQGSSGGPDGQASPGVGSPGRDSGGVVQQGASGSGGSAVDASNPSQDPAESGTPGTGTPGTGTPGSATGGGSPAGEEQAARTVSNVYQLAATKDYDASYGLLSSGFRQREVGSRQNWAGTFSTLESISFIEGPAASVSGDTARVTGTTRAVHTDDTEFNRGTWNLVRENGEWRLDSLSIQRLR